MNYKFLPIGGTDLFGGTDLWSHYPTASPFANDDQALREELATVPEQPRDEAHPQPHAIGEARMSGSVRVAPTPADDWMISGPRAAIAHLPEPAEVMDEPALIAAHYDTAVAAAEERSAIIHFTDTTLAPPTP